MDSQDQVHVFGRSAHPYLIFDPDGHLLDHRGEGLFNNAHAIHITPDDTVYFVDVGAHSVLKFSSGWAPLPDPGHARHPVRHRLCR